MLKRIMAMMMVMVMMTTFGSVTANAAKRDVEIDVYLNYDEVERHYNGPIFVYNKFNSFYLRPEGERVDGVEHSAKEFMLKYAELYDITDIDEDTVCDEFGELECKYFRNVCAIYFIYHDSNNNRKMVYVGIEQFFNVIYSIGL